MTDKTDKNEESRDGGHPLDLLTDTPSNDADADADVATTGHGRWRPLTIVADLAQEIAEASAEIAKQLDEIFRDMSEIVQALSAVAEQQRVGNLIALSKAQGTEAGDRAWAEINGAENVEYGGDLNQNIADTPTNHTPRRKQ